MGEFELIRRFFDRGAGAAVPSGVLLGVGDDCALLAGGSDESAPAAGGGSLADAPVSAVTVDLLVAGRHFVEDADPRSIGHKSLAVNLSDLAAMGATPRFFLLALALPHADAEWLAAFADGLFALADRHRCALVGGETTRGALTVSITAIGAVPPAQALRRDRARAGDDLWVSGELGGAAFAVEARAAGRAVPAGAADRLDWPAPRVELGIALRPLAHAAIDVSDGLIGDVGHLLERSSAAVGSPVGARIDVSRLPLDPSLAPLPLDDRLRLVLGGGDDYELAFTAPRRERAAIAALAGSLGLRISRIGSIDDEPGLRFVDADGRPCAVDARSYDHFR